MPALMSRRPLTRTEKIAIGISCVIVAVFALNARSGNEPPATTSPAGVALLDQHESATAEKAPVVAYEEAVETAVIPFEKTSVDDPNAPAGLSAITVVGVPGEVTRTYRVTLTDGVETARKLISEIVSIAPIPEQTSIGSYVAPPPPPPQPDASGCDPNYAGACVPIASDVDCAGGSGNGPAYVAGPVSIVGADIYDLDRDGDGIACD